MKRSPVLKYRPFKFTMERLEDRINLTSSPWLNPGSLTLSFVPDGTSVGGGMTSNLTSTFGASNTAAWEQTILDAFQSWASQANINIGVVADGGQPLGTAGLPQGDPRFGDIRIAAAPLGNPAVAGLAQTATANGGVSGTIQGDIIINSNAPITVGGVGGTYDLFSVILHEAGLGDVHHVSAGEIPPQRGRGNPPVDLRGPDRRPVRLRHHEHYHGRRVQPHPARQPDRGGRQHRPGRRRRDVPVHDALGLDRRQLVDRERAGRRH
jgi:hypothetical protein